MTQFRVSKHNILSLFLHGMHRCNNNVETINPLTSDWLVQVLILSWSMYAESHDSSLLDSLIRNLFNSNHCLQQ